MAWAATNIKALNQAIQLAFSITSQLLNELDVTFTTLNQSGAAFNPAAATTATLQIDNGQVIGSVGYQTHAVAVTVTGTTSTTLSINATAAALLTGLTGAFADGAPPTRGNYTLTASDGTTSLIISQGVWSMSGPLT